MDLLLVRHLWGVTEPWETALPRFHARGYGAVEAPRPSPADAPRLRALLDRHGLGGVAMVFTEGTTVADHVRSFREQLAAAAALRPLLVVAHSGRDAWDAADGAAFFADALAAGEDAGVPVAHETHRGRLLYAPWAAARYLDRFPALRLCADFSHWVCVAERLLDDQADTLAEAARRTLHVHARVGHAEGPQVADPRAPEAAAPLAAHERWWDAVWDAQEAAGRAVSTLTPEFGPPPYLPTLPYTGAPVADLDAICDWQAHRQRARFAARRAGAPPET